MKLYFSNFNKKMFAHNGSEGSTRNENKVKRMKKNKRKYIRKTKNRKPIRNKMNSTELNDKYKDINEKGLKLLSNYTLITTFFSSILILVFSMQYEEIYGIPALYFYDLDIKNITFSIFMVICIEFVLLYLVPIDRFGDKNKKINGLTILIFIVISVLNAASAASILFLIPFFKNIGSVFIISLFISFVLFYLTYKESNDSYEIICLIYGTIIISSIILTSGHTNPFYKRFELLGYLNSNYPTNEEEKQDEKSWKYLNDGVVITHYKGKLVVMDGIVNDKELVILKPGYKLIDGSDVKIKNKVFADHEIKDRSIYNPHINRTQKINDNICQSNKVFKLNTNDVYSEEFSIIRDDKTSEEKNKGVERDHNLNKLLCKVVSSGNFVFSDINIIDNSSNNNLSKDEFDIVTTDKGFTLSINEKGIRKLEEDSKGLTIKYKAKLDNIDNSGSDFIATYFDYGFNEEIFRNYKTGNSKEGKINLSVKWNRNDDDSNEPINSIYVLQQKESNTWKDLSFFISDSVEDFDYTFSGLDDKKIYRIQAIHSDNYNSDYVVIQDGKASIVNIKDKDDLVKNKALIQKFNMDKEAGEMGKLGV
ncbi:hypothetical protein [uncultured Anaerococcus sp.]|uniref:hypothetical protein n=1 Tax=uncultured Anaerococcus sp. TaxID=293428 RepID=UPI00280483D0|nr:hypothetical protein [uncultured Anaerococcus sp.]